ncbi:MAG: tRNA pseudouridine(55) synthase TruB, partial [Rickettsiales bacterium]|nr:tRNA pseudouridine(55) synthase TruB [Rickettsiales bacterium]
MNARKRKGTPVHGWIILDKPSGITSAHAVAKVKRLLKAEKIGHAGTLDPLASGVLPLALGEATKTVTYMMDTTKLYSFTATWGQERDTDDSEGQVVAESAERPKKEDILYVLGQFVGPLKQTPPVYSAIKMDGKRAYAMARAGEEVVMEARDVTVFRLELSDYAPDSASFICECSKGTYIRSLARDMGRALACLGYISALRRLKVGNFGESDAISLEGLEEMVHNPATYLRPVESALDDILAWDITPDQALELKMGRSIHLPGKVEDSASIFLLAMCEGKAVAVCSLQHGSMKP